MKKLIVAPLIAFTLFCNAQVIFGPEIAIGMGGTSYADPSNPARPTSFFSKAYGISVWSIQPSPVNVMAGIRFVESKNTLTSTYYEGHLSRKITTHYINIPARITFELFKPGHNRSISAYVGPEISYWLNGNVTINDVENGHTLVRQSIDFSQSGLDHTLLERIQYGFQAGFTFIQRNKKSNWALSLQYSHGISKQFIGDVAYASLPGFADDYAFRNRSLMLSTTCYLDFASKKAQRARLRHKKVRPYWKTDL